MFHCRYVFIFVILSLTILGCSPKTSDLIVATLGNEKITLNEYESFYSRNTGGKEAAKTSSVHQREEFLDLLIKYKLKLNDSYDRNFIADPEVITELNEYKGSLSSTYMVEKELIEPNIKELFERNKIEIRASHILIRVEATASPADTLIAYEKTVDLINRIYAGEDFVQIALENSEDPSVAQNNGDIYYFTAGQLVQPFEDAVYNMKIGDISKSPIRTAFGYHIIKVADKKPAVGSIRARHIMVRFTSPEPDSLEIEKAHSKIIAIQDSLKKGLDFEAMAIQFSDDGSSAPNGGDLGYFSRRRWIQSFDEEVFKLKIGQVSGIVKTPYGFHLIKCDDIKPLKSYEEMKPDLQRNFQAQRYEEAHAKFISGLKVKHNYIFDKQYFEELLSYLDSTKTTSDSAWDRGVSDESRNHALIKIGQKEFSTDAVISILKNRQEYRHVILKKSELLPKVEKIGEMFLLEESSKDLESKYPEFKKLMREYQDGVVLYKAEQTEVWNKLTVNDSLLKEYFNNNRDKFMTTDKVNISEINVEAEDQAKEIHAMLSAGVSFDSLAVEYNENLELKEHKGHLGLLDANSDELTKIAWKLDAGTFSQPISKEDDTYSIIMVNSKFPSVHKSYEEAGIEVSNLYQESEQKRLEKEWLDKIKQKYPVNKFPEVLKNAFQ